MVVLALLYLPFKFSSKHSISIYKEVCTCLLLRDIQVKRIDAGLNSREIDGCIREVELFGFVQSAERLTTRASRKGAQLNDTTQSSSIIISFRDPEKSGQADSTLR